MATVSNNKTHIDLEQDKNLQNALDRGIDDMEAGRELPLDEAMEKIYRVKEYSQKCKSIKSS